MEWVVDNLLSSFHHVHLLNLVASKARRRQSASRTTSTTEVQAKFVLNPLITRCFRIPWPGGARRLDLGWFVAAFLLNLVSMLWGKAARVGLS